jgi:hypothetical protein
MTTSQLMSTSDWINVARHLKRTSQMMSILNFYSQRLFGYSATGFARISSISLPYPIFTLRQGHSIIVWCTELLDAFKVLPVRLVLLQHTCL